jgi:UDPglucose 6-dehydrogenase
MQILGGVWEECEIVERAYVEFSKVKVVPTFKTDIVSASLLKYTINSWLATKVTFMNELYHLHKASDANTSWEQFTDMLQRDKRIGDSHLRVPGPDGSFGFGGHCFPKDTAGLLSYADKNNVELSVLSKAVEANARIRK